MKEKGRYIGLNQRVPFKLLNDGLTRLLDNQELSLEELKYNMFEYTKGENRAAKGSKYAYQILTRPVIMKSIKNKFDAESYNFLTQSDKQAMMLCLVAITFPITYDLLVLLSTAFKVQPQVNRALINSKMSAIYGSNRTLDIALDALIPMIIEMSTIKRTRISIYEIEEKKVIGNPFIAELFIYTDIKLSSSKTILVEDLQVRPWYMYFTPELNIDKLTILKHSESRLGGGYLAIK